MVLVDTPPHPEWEWNYSYQVEVNDLQVSVNYTAVILIKEVDNDEWGGNDWWWDDIEVDGDQYNYTFSLQQGCYYINATLYDKNDLNANEENAVVLAFDHLDFTVGNVECANQHWPERIFVWPDDVGGYDTAQNYSLTYNSGDNISVYTLYELDNLVSNITYLIEWYISNPSNTPLIASGNFTTNSTSNTGYSAPLPNASLNLSEGCYVVWAELHDDTGQLLDYDEFLLCIYDESNTTSNDSDGDDIPDSDDDDPPLPN